MEVIRRYLLNTSAEQTILMPKSAVILSVEMELDRPYLCARVNLTYPEIDRKFYKILEGMKIPEDVGHCAGCFQIQGHFPTYFVFSTVAPDAC